MASEERQSGAPLTEHLFREFYRYSFFKAVGLLENLFPEKKPIGKTLVPSEEAVRFSSKIGLAFPASDISRLEHRVSEMPVDMEIAFMGLIGPSGVLPHWYNELAMERVYHKDFSATAFYDMFNHRLISLFYLAWKKHKLSATYLPDGKDRISFSLLNLVGLGTPGLIDRFDIPDKSFAYYFSGLFSRQSPSASSIESALGCFADVPVRTQQFVEQLLPIDAGDQTQIGTTNSRLGVDTICGNHIYDYLSKFRIDAGPMGLKTFKRMLPGGSMIGPAFSLVRYMVGAEFEFDLRLILKHDEVPLCQLGQVSPVQPLLGWTTWVRAEGAGLHEDPSVTFGERDLPKIKGDSIC